MLLTKAIPSKSMVFRINLAFLAFFLVIYVVLLLRPSSPVYRGNAPSLVSCSLRQCHHKVDNGIKMKSVLEERQSSHAKPKRKILKREKPSFLDEMGKGMKIGMVNMEEEDTSEWDMHGQTIPIYFEQVSELFQWKDLFPEWIDEEEETEGPSCPEIPMPSFDNYEYMDMIVAKLPCKEGLGRDVFRLQVHLIAANLAVKRGKRRGWNEKTRMVFLSKCRPTLELFRCDDLVRQEGDWWFYEPEMARLEQKVSLPVGSCNLAFPLWGKGINEVYNLSKIIATNTTTVPKREAYATVLHSSESYVCGAITLAQSLLQTGTKRDLILLIDNSISIPKRQALASAGWKIRIISRIRNPKAQKNSYNEYNYSKFRLWQLTDYDKVIFIDADIIVLRNLDLLFHFPQISATGNDGAIFNSGIMVIEPSNCTFKIFMRRRREITSYNGGDQGLPRRVNFLKNFWSNTSGEESVKNQLFGSDPPKLYSIHYIGLKPWQCYRDYDCNWDIGAQRVYASDVAHRRWWKVHDAMGERLQKLCGLSERRKIELEWDRKKAREMGLPDHHCWINVTDPRRQIVLAKLTNNLINYVYGVKINNVDWVGEKT
ncbi:hypothetical protein CsSME_00013134 [Camellia sinensis var. sinensis]